MKHHPDPARSWRPSRIPGPGRAELRRDPRHTRARRARHEVHLPGRLV